MASTVLMKDRKSGPRPPAGPSTVGVAGLLLVAGPETTAHMFALAVVTLLRHLERLAALKEDAALWPAYGTPAGI